VSPTAISPLDAVAREQGARFAESAGWQTPVSFGSPDGEAQAARTRVALIDQSGRGKFEILGADGERLLYESLGLVAVAIGRGQPTRFGHLYRLRSDLHYGSTDGDPMVLVDDLQAAAADRFVTLTDLSHARSELWLVGPRSRATMARVCGLDLHTTAFPDGSAAIGSVAKTTQLIVRRDLAGILCFLLIGARSYGDYLWKVLLKAGAEWQIQPSGTAALGMLQD
jgi:sarcosine oxidase subunit alpha